METAHDAVHADPMCNVTVLQGCVKPSRPSTRTAAQGLKPSNMCLDRAA